MGDMHLLLLLLAFALLAASTPLLTAAYYQLRPHKRRKNVRKLGTPHPRAA